jgi:hypothetical protein
MEFTISCGYIESSLSWNHGFFSTDVPSAGRRHLRVVRANPSVFLLASNDFDRSLVAAISEISEV